jgi:hypothetical protein
MMTDPAAYRQPTEDNSEKWRFIRYSSARSRFYSPMPNHPQSIVDDIDRALLEGLA